MVNSCVRCCFGVGYSGFYIFISVWGVLFLGVLGILMKTGHEGNIGIEYKRGQEDEMRNKYGDIMLITVGIYLAFCIGCAVNIWYRLRHPWPDVVDPKLEEQFRAIGPKNFEQAENENQNPETLLDK